MGKFKELRVWNDGIDLAEMIYTITRTGAFSKDFGLCDQIRRAVVSISSNIAEGDERETDRQAVYFFSVAKGSTAEVDHAIAYCKTNRIYRFTNTRRN